MTTSRQIGARWKGEENEVVHERNCTVIVVGFLLYVFKTVYVVDGKLDYFRLWMLFGIPFGLTRLCIWFLPRGYDIGGTVGMLTMSVVLTDSWEDS